MFFGWFTAIQVPFSFPWKPESYDLLQGTQQRGKEGLPAGDEGTVSGRKRGTDLVLWVANFRVHQNPLGGFKNAGAWAPPQTQ